MIIQDFVCAILNFTAQLDVNQFDIGSEMYHNSLQQQYNVYKYLYPDSDRGIVLISPFYLELFCKT